MIRFAYPPAPFEIFSPTCFCLVKEFFQPNWGIDKLFAGEVTQELLKLSVTDNWSCEMILSE